MNKIGIGVRLILITISSTCRLKDMLKYYKYFDLSFQNNPDILKNLTYLFKEKYRIKWGVKENNDQVEKYANKRKNLKA